MAFDPRDLQLKRISTERMRSLAVRLCEEGLQTPVGEH